MMITEKRTKVNNGIAVFKDLAIVDVKLAWDEALNVRCDAYAPLGAARCIVFDADLCQAIGEFSSNKRIDRILGC
jgi:hypothetical protein